MSLHCNEIRKISKMIWFMCFGIFILKSVHGDRLVATFSRNNIVGTVSFVESKINYRAATRIIFNFNAKLRDFNIVAEIHKGIVTYDNRCNGIGETISNLRRVSPNSRITSKEISTKGPESILGATLLIYDLDTKVTTCASILPSGKSIYAKVAISNSKIAGSFEFLQGRSGETLIVGEVSKSDGSTTKSFVHDWHIANERECGSGISTIYDPFYAYSYFCSKFKQNRCPVGDLVSKHGALNIGIAGNEGIQVIDTNLPLRNAISRVLVIKSNTNPQEVLGCGKIVMAGPLEVQARFIRKLNEGIYGTLNFKQQSPYHPTELTVKLSGLNGRVNGYHVHEYPISDPVNKCSAASVGEHLNPFQVDIKKSPKPRKGSTELFEVGDLSGKIGFLRGKSAIRRFWIDPNLPVYGLNTIVGRSVVLHRPGGSRLTCTSIEPRQAQLLTGTIDFTANKNSILKGSVIMRQFKQKNGVLSPTVFVVDLKYKEDNSRVTRNHDWHVHISALNDDEGAICSSALGHYNPAMVDVSNPTYPVQCSSEFPYRCEVGDSSSKVGTYDIGGGKKFYGDVDTPLFGDFTSLGRSMVFHAENKGTARLSCADIISSSSSMRRTKMFSRRRKNKQSSLKEYEKQTSRIR